MGKNIISVQVLDLGKPKSRPFVANRNRIQIGKPLNLVVPEFPRQKTEFDFDAKDYHSFGIDNLFPQGLAAINRQAITSRSILAWKAIYTAGKGFITDDDSLLEWTKAANPEENFRSVFKKVVEDYNEFGNAYVEVVTDRANTFFFMFHHDATAVRIGKKTRDGFVGLFPDWAQVQGREERIVWVPIFKKRGLEEGEDGLLHTFVHIRDYEPQFPIYGLAEWVAGMDAAAIGYKTNKWNVSRLDNQFSTSGILEIYGDKSDKKLLEQIKKFKEKKTGEGNNAQLLVIVRERGADAASNYTPLIQTNEGDWINLHKQSDQDMIIAHNWFRSLTGLAEAGTLGNTQQIRNEYQIARETVISDTQDVILDSLSSVFEDLGGFDAEGFRVRNTSPLSIEDRIDINFLITREEGYKIVGIEPNPKDENLDQTIKVNTATPDEPRPAD